LPGPGFGVDEDWPRQRERLKVVEGIVGKKDSAVFADLKSAQTVAARAISGCHLNIRRMPVAGRTHRRSDEIGNLARDGDNAEEL
jgi:hypothetical protein